MLLSPQGVALFQDLIAILAMVLLSAFQHVMLDLTPVLNTTAASAHINITFNVLPAINISSDALPALASRRGTSAVIDSAVADSVATNATAWNESFTNATATLSSPAASRFSYAPPQNVWHDRYRLGDEILVQLVFATWMALVFAFLNRFWYACQPAGQTDRQTDGQADKQIGR